MSDLKKELKMFAIIVAAFYMLPNTVHTAWNIVVHGTTPAQTYVALAALVLWAALSVSVKSKNKADTK